MNQPAELNIVTGNPVKINIDQQDKRKLRLGGAIPISERDYDKLKNKPQINGVTLQGNKTARELNIGITDPLTNMEIEAMLANVFN